MWLTLGLSMALVCLLLATLPVLVWFVKGQRVAAAVEASFPELCSEWRDKIVTHPSPVGWFTHYDVVCVYGYTPDRPVVMTVNVLTCEARPALTWPRDWRHLQKMLFSGGHKMAMCP
jgi:hypothetical protein